MPADRRPRFSRTAARSAIATPANSGVPTRTSCGSITCPAPKRRPRWLAIWRVCRRPSRGPPSRNVPPQRALARPPLPARTLLKRRNNSPGSSPQAPTRQNQRRRSPRGGAPARQPRRGRFRSQAPKRAFRLRCRLPNRGRRHSRQRHPQRQPERQPRRHRDPSCPSCLSKNKLRAFRLPPQLRKAPPHWRGAPRPLRARRRLRRQLRAPLPRARR